MLQLQIREGDPHGSGETRGILELDLHAVAAPDATMKIERLSFDFQRSHEAACPTSPRIFAYSAPSGSSIASTERAPAWKMAVALSETHSKPIAWSSTTRAGSA